MNQIQIIFRLFLLWSCAALVAACGGGGNSASTDATLAGLSISTGPFDQLFQSSQPDYTADVSFIVASLAVTATTTDPNASITINGNVVNNAANSPPIALAEGANSISIKVTAADGTTTETYTLTITRATAASFAQQAYFKASNAEAGDQFGRSIALAGDTLVVGAPNEASSANANEADNSTPSAGAVYVFTRSAGVWTQQAYLKASNAEGSDFFGYSVAIAGDTLVVGAYLEDSSAAGGEADNSAGQAGAAYVFTRDAGVWTQQAYLKASNADAGDNFGYSVAIAGGTLVVGAYLEASSAVGGEINNSAPGAGAAYVFTRNAGTWTQEAYLKASNGEGSDFFGFRVAIAGDTVVVGAYGEDSNAVGGETNNSAGQAGAVYVFTRSAGAWIQQAYLKASNAQAGDQFGRSVAVSGDTVVVGAYLEAGSVGGGEADNSAPGAGAAYVFTRNAGAWTQQAYLKASNGETGDNFGASVDIADGTVVVGANLEDSSAAGGEEDNSAPGAGAAYVFTRSAGVWTQQAYLKASNAENSDFFGFSIALGGGTLIAGAYLEDSSATGGEADNSATFAGAGYLW